MSVCRTCCPTSAGKGNTPVAPRRQAVGRVSSYRQRENNGYSPAEVAPLVGLSEEQASRVFKDIDSKAAVARYLLASPQLMPEIEVA